MGGCLPDGPFYHPAFGVESVPALDIFGLGSLFYTVITGLWPYRSSPGSPETIDEKLAYEDRLAELFSQEKFPDVGGLAGASVMTGCWTRRYATAEEILVELRMELRVHGVAMESE